MAKKKITYHFGEKTFKSQKDLFEFFRKKMRASLPGRIIVKEGGSTEYLPILAKIQLRIGKEPKMSIAKMRAGLFR